MNTLKWMRALACLVLVGGAQVPSHAEAATDTIPHLYVIGDSTASNYKEDLAPRTGWAQVLQDAFDPAKLIVDNRARSGRSSKSFYDEGAWTPIADALKPGDFVFIQFGHNDSKKDDPKRYTEPATTYTEHLQRYIDETRAKGATPILVTSINRNSWNEDGTFRNSLDGYPDAMRALAKKTDTSLLDLCERTRVLYESLGQEKTKALFMYLDKGASPNFPDGISDGTHLCLHGAKTICDLVVAELKSTSSPLAAFLK